jgi:hypothetical protein
MLKGILQMFGIIKVEKRGSVIKPIDVSFTNIEARDNFLTEYGTRREVRGLQVRLY